MVRVCKSLIPPEQGYAHRDHRSNKGRSSNYKAERFKRIKKKRVLEKIAKLEQGRIRGIIYE